MAGAALGATQAEGRAAAFYRPRDGARAGGRAWQCCSSQPGRTAALASPSSFGAWKSRLAVDDRSFSIPPAACGPRSLLQTASSRPTKKWGLPCPCLSRVLGTHADALAIDAMSKRGRDESNGWKGTHVLAVAQFDDAMLLKLFDAARRMKLMVAAKGKSDVLRGKVETLALALALARCSPTFLYEPSTEP